MQSPEYNLKLVQAMLEDIEDYLLSNELFWPMHSSARRDMPAPPRLTPGVLVLALDELNAQNVEMTPGQEAEYQKRNLQMQRVFQKWPEAL